MKRVLAIAFALALAVGALAPAAFADDYVPAQIPITDLYADPELYDLYVAPYYNNLSFSDWGDYATDAVISGFPMDTVKQIETTEGGLESLWNTVHNAFTFGYNIGQDWVSKLYVDTSDGRLKSNGNIMTDDLKALLDQYFKSAPSMPIVNTTHANWLVLGTSAISFTTGGASFILSSTVSPTYYAVIQNGNNTVGLFATENSVFTARNTGRYPFTASNNNATNSHPYYAGSAGGYRPSFYPEFASWYTDITNLGVSYADLVNELFDESPSVPSGDWNGDGYYRDDYVVDIALPAIPAIDWKDLNNNYYTEYGGDFVDGDVNNFYYDISYNYFPAEFTYTVPYWLIDGNTSVLDFDYSLELPSVELYELPSEFEGGDGVWDASFSMLGGFGAFVLLGFSFGLVALFFKD